MLLLSSFCGCFENGLLFVAERYTAFGKVVGRHLHTHLVAGKNLDVMHTHLAGDVGCDFVAVFQLHAEHGVGEGLENGAVLFDC